MIEKTTPGLFIQNFIFIPLNLKSPPETAGTKEASKNVKHNHGDLNRLLGLQDRQGLTITNRKRTSANGEGHVYVLQDGNQE